MIKITSDSTCDLSPDLLCEYDIGIVPLHINKGDETFRDGIDIVPDDIYRHVDAGGDITTTSAVNPADYAAFFEPLSKEYDAVIHIDISSEFSACYQNACLAAREFTNVFVVDSRNLSTGHGHVVLEAAKMSRKNMDPRAICDHLNELTQRVEASFILDRLDYLRKGGRCSAVAALGANLLKLKPCIEVADGKMRVGKKYRGAFDKCIREYVKDRLDGRSDIAYERIFITHAGVDPSILAAARETVEQYSHFAEILETRAGCTISSHGGPNTLGVLFIRK